MRHVLDFSEGVKDELITQMTLNERKKNVTT